jgi:hypothetical protein
MARCRVWIINLWFFSLALYLRTVHGKRTMTNICTSTLSAQCDRFPHMTTLWQIQHALTRSLTEEKRHKHNVDETFIKILPRFLLLVSLCTSVYLSNHVYNLRASEWVFTIVKLFRSWLKHFSFVEIGQNAWYFMDDILNCVTRKDINFVSFLKVYSAALWSHCFIHSVVTYAAHFLDKPPYWQLIKRIWRSDDRASW